MKPLDCLPLYEDAWFYDQEFKDRAHEIPFYVRRAIASGGPVLELACGSGRLTIPIARAGVQIVGVDVSEPMIDRARQRSGDIEWHVQDVRALDLDLKFRLAFIATNALQHLHDPESISAFFDGVRRHLAPDGVLIIDVFNPAPDKLARRLGSPYHHKTFTLEDGQEIQVDADSEYLQDSKVLHFILTYRHRGSVMRTKDVRMRCFFPDELLSLCRSGGFEIVERLGEYDESAFGPGSPKQILVCRKS